MLFQRRIFQARATANIDGGNQGYEWGATRVLWKQFPGLAATYCLASPASE